MEEVNNRPHESVPVKQSHKVRIEMTDHGRGCVFIDDVEVKAVVGVDFQAGLNRKNEVSITILAREVEVTSMKSVAHEYVRGHPSDEDKT